MDVKKINENVDGRKYSLIQAGVRKFNKIYATAVEEVKRSSLNSARENTKLTLCRGFPDCKSLCKLSLCISSTLEAGFSYFMKSTYTLAS